MKPSIFLIDDLILKNTLSKEYIQSPGVDLGEIREILRSREEEDSPVPEDSEPSVPTADGLPYAQVFASPDGMEAYLVLFAPGDGEEPLSRAHILDVLGREGICFGILEGIIDRLVRNPVYGRRFLIARGTPPSNDRRHVQYHFNTDFSFAPAVYEGKQIPMDFRHLPWTQQVKKGDLLCHVEGSGVRRGGIDVHGKTIPGLASDDASIRRGRNTLPSKDWTQLFAACDGEVSLENGLVCVDPILELEQVDETTGNIDFKGSIYIHGNIDGGYSVTAGRNLFVGAVVEDARLKAGGHIVIGQGSKGLNNSQIEAGGCLQTIYLENVLVKTGGSLYADAALSCNITCQEKAVFTGRWGRIVSGLCKAREIDALQLGNESGTQTVLSILDNRAMETEIARLSNRYDELSQKVFSIQGQLRRGASDVSAATAELIRVSCDKNQASESLNRLMDDLERYSGCTPQITVRDTVYNNVAIRISRRIYRSQRPLSQAVFYSDGNSILKRSYIE